MGNEDEHDDQPQEPGGQGGNGNGNGQGNGNGNGRKGEPLEVELSRQPSYLADMHALRRNRSLRMLVGGDLHNHQRAMRWFYKLAEQQQPDLIVFLGDFVNGEPLEYIREICASLRTLASHVFVIPGNHDPRQSLITFEEESYDGLKSIHKSNAFVGGYSFAGLGTSITTPSGSSPFEFPDEGFADALASMLPADIWVLHNPLEGILDKLADGRRLGSRSLRQLYDEQHDKPMLVISGHVHDAHGMEQQGGTVFVNPGALVDGRAAMLTLGGDSLEVKFKAMG
ncbi:MAG: metallophosphoesterase family protein [Planctomycetales bacterium]|nr:metallophosphoesterase family protein [bacterium]UNM08494.1 MAG: metallophosphoesterase family protein [Planctomycetales bacterium]